MEFPYTYFAEVVRQGSIRKAAERLHVSASSISRQIVKMEHEFGVPLLARRAHGVKLTPAGEILAQFIHNRSREFVRLQALIDELKNLERGHVSLYTVEGMLGGFLPKALAEFAHQHPLITYELVVGGTEDVMRAVAEDRCDIGIAFEPQPRTAVDVVGHMSQPVLAVVPPDHPFAAKKALKLRDLLDVPVGVPDKSFGIRHIIERAMETEAVDLQIRLETNSIDMVRQFALFGMGVGFLPAFAFQREAAAGTLIGVRLMDEAFASASAQVCKHAEFELTWAARRLFDCLVEASHSTLVLR